jgi:hypothetical protein
MVCAANEQAPMAQKRKNEKGAFDDVSANIAFSVS